jgi:hypothetical protein
VTIRGPQYGRFEENLLIDDGEIYSPCGGGVLRILYRVRATGESSTPEVDDGEPPPGVEAWAVTTSLMLVKC